MYTSNLCILFFAQCLREPSNYSTTQTLTQPCPILLHWKLKAGEGGTPTQCWMFSFSELILVV